MRADAILPCKPFPPLEIERREACKLALASKLINDELRGIFSGRNESDGFHAQVWATVGLRSG